MEVDFFGLKMSVVVKKVSFGGMGLGKWDQTREELESVAMTMGWFDGGLWRHGCFLFLVYREVSDKEVTATQFLGGLISFKFYLDEGRTKKRWSML